jgi:hypothetical protein
METLNNHSRYGKFGSGGSILRAYGNQPLEDAEIIARCPSVFADQAHESRSESYSYLPTVQLLSGLRTEGFFPVEVRQGGSRDEVKRGFTKHLIRLRRDLDVLADHKTEVVLINSHDGTSSYQLMHGIFRMICSNGLISGDFDGVKVGHRGNILDDVINASYTVVNESEKIVPLIEDWSHLTLDRNEQTAFATAAKELRLDADAEIRPETIIKVRRQADVGDDLWRVFNRAQENLVRGGIPYDTRDANNYRVHRHVREAKSIDSNVKLNRALWTLAAEMAKIKGVALAA